jgi:hypothetical protein
VAVEEKLPVPLPFAVALVERPQVVPLLVVWVTPPE